MKEKQKIKSIKELILSLREDKEAMKELDRWLNEQNKIACDNCKFYTDYPTVKIEFNYGSLLDGEDFIFCSDKCLKEFVEREVNITK